MDKYTPSESTAHAHAHPQSNLHTHTHARTHWQVCAYTHRRARVYTLTCTYQNNLYKNSTAMYNADSSILSVAFSMREGIITFPFFSAFLFPFLLGAWLRASLTFELYPSLRTSPSTLLFSEATLAVRNSSLCLVCQLITQHVSLLVAPWRAWGWLRTRHIVLGLWYLGRGRKHQCAFSLMVLARTCRYLSSVFTTNLLPQQHIDEACTLNCQFGWA